MELISSETGFKRGCGKHKLTPGFTASPQKSYHIFTLTAYINHTGDLLYQCRREIRQSPGRQEKANQFSFHKTLQKLKKIHSKAQD